MKHRQGKWLAMLLIFALTLTMVPEAAFAAEVSSTPGIEEQTPGGQNEEAEQEMESDVEAQGNPDSEETQPSGQPGDDGTKQPKEESVADDTEQPKGESVIDNTEQPKEESVVDDTEQPKGEPVIDDTEQPKEQLKTDSDEFKEETGIDGAEQPKEEPAADDAEQPKEQLEAGNTIQLKALTVESSDTQTDSSVAKVGDKYYDTLAEAFNAVGEKGTVELVANVKLSTRILIGAGKDITLDLGSYTVKSDGGFFGGNSMLFENRGTFTVKGAEDGTIDASVGSNPFIGIENKANGKVNVLSGNITASKNGIRNISGTLNISGGTITNTSSSSDGQDCAVYASDGSTTVISGDAQLKGSNTALRSYGAAVTVSENAHLEGQFGVLLFNSPAENTEDTVAHSKFTMTGGTVNATNGLALSGNNLQSALCSAEITGGTLKAIDEATAIYWPMEGSLTVGDSAVVEGGTGIEAKMGTINITGGTITGTGKYLADKPYAGGSQSEGSALLVASQMYGANENQYIDSPALTVTITGGNLSGTQGNAVTVYNTENIEAQETEVTVTGGALNAASGRADVYVVNENGSNNDTRLESTESGNNLTSSQSQTTVTVSSKVAAAAVDEGGNISYYTDVNEALAANTESTETPVEIYILKDSEIDSTALESKNVTLIAASGVALTVESSVEGTKVSETTNEDGSKTYELVTAYNTVYVNGKEGNDNNTGQDADNAVQTLERALELVAHNGVIYICGQVTVDSSLTVNGVKIERADGYTGGLISVSGSNAVLTLSNTVIDGKKAAETVYGGYLIFVTQGGTLNIEEGTQLINNNASAVYVNVGSFFNMYGGLIKDNTTLDPTFGGAGIYTCGTTKIYGGEISRNSTSIWGGGILAERGTLFLNGGEIKNNSAANGAGVTINSGVQAVLDGALITDNKAENYGAGVYLEGFSNSDNQDTVFEMKSGVISGNVSKNAMGAGIYGYYYSGGTIIRISGGTIKDNVSEKWNLGNAVAIYGLNSSGAYPRVELSGSPEIVGDIYYQNDAPAGYVIHVTGAFTPVNPIEITRSNHTSDIPAVEYASGLTPNREDFVSGELSSGFVIKGQNLIWAKASIVYFYNEDNVEYKDNRRGVVMGEKIDPADAPEPSKQGYTFVGWYEKDSMEPWNFEEDIVKDAYTMLYERWNLNTPDVTISADTPTVHEGMNVTLTAVPSHEVAGVIFTYQWYRDGVAIAGENESKLAVREDGSYSVEVTAYDGMNLSSKIRSNTITITKESHTFDTVWNSDTQKHWHVCTVCGARADEAAHTFAWVTDQKATATKAGSRHEQCTVCGYAKAAVEIPATGTSGGGHGSEETTSSASGQISEAANNQSAAKAVDSAKTGDNSNLALWITMVLSASAVLIGVVLYSQKKKYRR